ncbi:MAG: hypothetical protein FJ033_13955 [Chloroflexi bacterium]|nr:hypothetical protein [Chloroflexota bacterium]
MTDWFDLEMETVRCSAGFTTAAARHRLPSIQGRTDDRVPFSSLVAAQVRRLVAPAAGRPAPMATTEVVCCAA